MAEFGAPTQLTKDDLLDVLRRNFEAHWIEGLLADPSSLSIFEGAVVALLRVQDAIDESIYRGGFILSSSGRAPATSVVRLSRPSGLLGVIGINTRFIDDRGAIWKPTADFSVPASGGAQTVDVPIQTERVGYYLNSFEALTYQIVDALFDPNLVVVPGPSPAANGKSPMLDQHGKERRTPRAPGETDASYKNRMRFLEDAVSPRAIALLVAQVLDGFSTTRTIADLIFRWGLRATREPFNDGSQLAAVGLQALRAAFWDDVQPIPVAGTIPDPGGTFFNDTFGHVLRDIDDDRAWLDLFLPTPVDPGEIRQFWDDASGNHGFFWDDPLLGMFDVSPSNALLAPIEALADELWRKHGGGVGVRIFFGTVVSLTRHPPAGSLANAGSWVNQAALATDLALTSSIDEFDGDDSYDRSATGAGAGGPTAAGDLRFSLAAPPAPLAISHVVLRAKVRRSVVGAGVNPILQFVVQPTTAGAGQRVGPSFTIDFDDWRPVELILDVNPITAVAWVLADIAGNFVVGIANVAAVGATEQLRVSELALEFVVNYG